MAGTAGSATAARPGSPGKALFASLVVLGPVVSVALFILAVALAQGIPPKQAAPGQPLWVGLLFYAVPFFIGLFVSTRGIAGLLGWGVWASIGAGLVVVVVGIALISAVLWRVGWPVLVTGGY